MTDDELKKLREKWISEPVFTHDERSQEVLTIIDEALSRGAQLKALQESEAALDGHCNAHIALLDEARAALAKAEQEREQMRKDLHDLTMATRFRP